MVSDPESVSDDLPPEPAASQAVKKPLLASEALMEDLAPEEPWRAGARWWALFAGLLLLATAAPPWLAATAPGVSLIAPHLAAGGLALLCAALPLPYVARGIGMLLIAFTTIGLVFAELGPLSSLHQTVGVWWLVHAAAAILLPAALLFRERYRALARARYVLGFSVLLALGFVGFCVLTIMTGDFVAQLTSVVGIIAVVLSLLGFMGSEAPIAGSLLSALIVVTVTAQLTTVVVLSTPLAANLSGARPIAGVVAFAATALLGALGIAQLLAAGSFRHARSIDFRRGNTERPPLPSLTSDTWTGRR